MSDGPEIVLLYCRQAVLQEVNVDLLTGNADCFSVRAVMLPCSSKVQVPYLLKILDDGADAVEVVACHSDACRFLVGSDKAEKRIAYAGKLLDEIGIGAERLGITRANGLSAEKLMDIARGRAEAVRSIMIGRGAEL
ncbi:MAG: hydrogenase iron-sulfur subunit [Kiritimatiellae bacterium]|nr:hydrogenase iron-sulfur subunit [Kiritimatiellia bacterium]